MIKIGSIETEAVKAIQLKLGLTVDGGFGPKTEMAVKAFQEKNGLTADGIIGDETATKMGVDLSLYKKNGYMLTIGVLKYVTGINNIKQLTEVTSALNDTIAKYDINTPLRVCHFLAQLLHESNNLQATKENLNYSAKALSITFKKYFPTEALANAYARQPDKIANKVYANRMGNGPAESNDGASFKGRGYIQITGKDNYKELSRALGVDFIAHPELMESPKYAVLSAGWYWNEHNINRLADKDNAIGITKTINGGVNGLDDRLAHLAKLKSIIK